jgi:hypothetical protein
MTNVARLVVRLWLFVLVLAAIHAWPRTATAQFLSPGPLSKVHAGVEGDQHCNDCHASGKRIDTQGCLKCHSDLGARITAGAGLHGREYKGQACEKCHGEHLGLNSRIVRWPGGDPKALNHALTGWPLENAHKPVACEKCHTKPNMRGNKTYIGQSPACAACHKDQHGGRFGTTCTGCHNDVAWTALHLDNFDHNQAKFPLKGAHQKVKCEKCHEGQPPKYTGLQFASCLNCHKDPHAGKLGPNCAGCHDEAGWKKVNFQKTPHPGVSLANGHAPVRCATCHDKGNAVSPSKGSDCVSCHRPVHDAPFGRACGTCHATIQWLGLARSVGLASHSKTPYPLTGKHTATSCAGCHRPELAENARYRALKFGQCKDCHKDSHNGEFAAKDGGECAACHSTAGYTPTLFGVALHEATKFPLTGRHAAVACRGCHAETRPRLNLKVAKQACADCHANPHGDQFAVEMQKGGCAFCHETSSFRRAKFDHSTWPLTGAHATADCESCHHPSAEDRKTGRGASYRGVPRDCGGCHDDLHSGQFRTKAPIYECNKCHSTKVFKIPQFDHAGIAKYPLTGGHAKVQCAQCHLPEKLASGKTAIRYRLPSWECSDCHKNPHGGAVL